MARSQSALNAKPHVRPKDVRPKSRRANGRGKSRGHLAAVDRTPTSSAGPPPRDPARPSRLPASAASRLPASARETLLREARHLFATRGLSGTSIRDIARAANMNSSQISYYFAHKVGLYRACVADIAQNRSDIAAQILRPPESREEYSVRLKLYLENMFDYFLQNRDQGLIVIREYDRLHSPAENVFHAYFSRVFVTVENFFKRALDRNFTRFDDNSDPLILAGLLIGAIVNELRMDHIKLALYKRSISAARERELVISHILHLFV